MTQLVPAPVRVRAAPVRRAVVGSARNSQLEPVPDRRVSPQRAVKGDKPTDEEGLVMACERRAA